MPINVDNQSPETSSEPTLAEIAFREGTPDQWLRGQRTAKENHEYRQRMGNVAMQLVNALVPEDDPHDRSTLVDSVLEALNQ